MDSSLGMVLIACVGCFLAGIMNASGGSGGLISVPALMLCGLDSHEAIGTNKIQAFMGIIVAVIRYAREGFISLPLVIPSVICSAIGAALGATLSLRVSNEALLYVMFLLLPVCAWAVLSRKTFANDRPEEVRVTPGLLARMGLIALVCGTYDGFYGPGCGTFLVIAITVFTDLGVKHTTAHAKVINLTDNVVAFFVFLAGGSSRVQLGIIAGLCAMAGSWIGSGAVIKQGGRFMKPLLGLALILLIVNVITKL